ncbi:hypothetical protein CVT24_011615 [Panaeolus cyanescens]|uniref:RNA methyltransferase n=1 Tax=Panaeolus cyanescens TaxID=181874 RepID=A0A409YGX6_9AGAR|nr:hypothetical protein CVT24_011615 [Panaeolus cyanescens]
MANNHAIHGNYHGYYAKRPVATDERLAVLPSNIFQGCRVLDIGCNEGWLTCDIAQNRGATFVVGVDIDDSLIQGAWRRRRAIWSMQGPTSGHTELVDTDPSPPTKKRKKNDTQDKDEEAAHVASATPLSGYFPASCEHELGPLPIPPSTRRGKTVFPHNIAFRTADWVTTTIVDDAEGYNVVLALSVSKWIHLNDGDEGIKTFFKRVYGVLQPGGRFVFEPQPWESYAKARRMDPKLKENASKLTLRPNDFTALLQELGFKLEKCYNEVGEGGFKRSIEVYLRL